MQGQVFCELIWRAGCGKSTSPVLWGVLKFLTRFEYCDTPQTERVEKQGIQSKPGKGLIHHSDRGSQYAGSDLLDQIIGRWTTYPSTKSLSIPKKYFHKKFPLKEKPFLHNFVYNFKNWTYPIGGLYEIVVHTNSVNLWLKPMTAIESIFEIKSAVSALARFSS